MTTAATNERLERITNLGTSIWLDQIQRSLTQTGELARMVEEESLRVRRPAVRVGLHRRL